MNEVNRTLFIPLYGKAYVSERKMLLSDPKAEEIWGREGFPLKGKSKSRWLAYYMAMRAGVFDDWVREKAEKYPESVILHLGCGLDSRILRTGIKDRQWFDVDFPEVIDQRRCYYSDTANYHMIAGDLRREDWLQEIPRGAQAIVAMEGVSMYLTRKELEQLLTTLGGYFSRVELLMDTYSPFAAKASRYKNPVNDVGVTQVYGLDDPEALAKNTDFLHMGEREMTPDGMIAQLPARDQRLFRLLYAGKFAKGLYHLHEFQRMEKLP